MYWKNISIIYLNTLVQIPTRVCCLPQVVPASSVCIYPTHSAQAGYDKRSIFKGIRIQKNQTEVIARCLRRLWSGILRALSIFLEVTTHEPRFLPPHNDFMSNLSWLNPYIAVCMCVYIYICVCVCLILSFLFETILIMGFTFWLLTYFYPVSSFKKQNCFPNKKEKEKNKNVVDIWSANG